MWVEGEKIHPSQGILKLETFNMWPLGFVVIKYENGSIWRCQAEKHCVIVSQTCMWETKHKLSKSNYDNLSAKLSVHKIVFNRY